MAEILSIEERTSDYGSVRSCARCGGDHDGLQAVSFHQPILDHEDGFEWRWWVTCPATGDPILVRETDAG